jgi:hypothetical protein
MDSTRSHALTQIMQIEDQVTQAVKSKRYMKIRQNVHDLKDTNGKAIITVENPDNQGRQTQVRKNSKNAKKILHKYELLLYEYQILFNELNKQKNKYKKQLFS